MSRDFSARIIFRAYSIGLMSFARLARKKTLTEIFPRFFLKMICRSLRKKRHSRFMSMTRRFLRATERKHTKSRPQQQKHSHLFFAQRTIVLHIKQKTFFVLLVLNSLFLLIRQSPRGS